MPTAAFTTLGCKVNQYETQRIRDSFAARGFTVVDPGEPADVYVVNTCSVTQTAEGKSRQTARRLLAQNPRAVLVLTGCYVELVRLRGEPVGLAQMVVPQAQKERTVDLLLAAYPELTPRPCATPTAPTPVGHRTRAVLKVQDGCDQFCSYCSIPYTRSEMVSRPAEEVLAEARALAAAGHREVVVTGVLVGSYGRATGSGGPDLAALLKAVAATPGIERVRLSSVEPVHVTEALLDAFARTPGLCPHLHLPLQSGDTGVLGAMNRPYSAADYVALCKRATEAIPDLAITADILVGFPGETDAAFSNTEAVCREAGFARAHVFRFSARPGTPAASLPGAVSAAAASARARRLGALCRDLQGRYAARYVGRVLPVLVEEPGPDGRLTGYTPNYIRVTFDGPVTAAGTVQAVRLTAADSRGAVGELAAPLGG